MSRHFAYDGLPRPQGGSKMAQEGPMRGPGEPQGAPEGAHERSNIARERLRMRFLGLPRGAAIIEAAIWFDRGPSAPLELPRAPQEGPRRRPVGSKRRA
eukprot:5843628-Pyramimonas_sp.AAC.1